MHGYRLRACGQVLDTGGDSGQFLGVMVNERLHPFQLTAKQREGLDQLLTRVDRLLLSSTR
jgi:hypothetical protein